MRFRSSQSRPPFLNRKDQTRLLGLCGTLILVLVAVKVAADPATWAWMFPPGEHTVQKDSGAAAINVGLQDDASADAIPVPAPKTSDTDLRIDPKVLSNVRDDFSGIRRAEADAYHDILSQLAGTDEGRLEDAARTDVGYTLLMADPDRYRGGLITLEGEVRRLLPLLPTEGQTGQLYEAWLFTRESGTNPYRVVATEIPAQMRQGESLRQPVRVTGYFLKRQGYDAQGGLRVAPLLLAKTLQPLRVPAEQPRRRGAGLTRYVAGFAVLIAVALVVTLWRYAQSDKTFERRHKRRLTEASPEAIAQLNDIETVDTAESLRQMSEEAKRR